MFRAAAAPSDQVTLGLIGAGGRGTFVMTVFQKDPALKVGAICDVYEPNLERGLSTAKKGRDAEMYKMFRLPEFATAQGAVRGFDLAAARAGGGVALPFDLTIIGVSQSLTGKVDHVQASDGQLAFDADFTIDMKSFTLKPKVLLGLFRVRNEVPVRAAFTLHR